MDQQDFLNGQSSGDTTENTAEDAADQGGETAADNGDGEAPYYQQTIINEDGEEETVNAQ